MSTTRRLLRPTRRPLLALLCAALASCGGGVWIGIGDGFDGGGLPHVTLDVSPRVATPGQTLQLVAAASDRNGIREVFFYRIDPDQSQSLLGSVRNEPYVLSTTMPAAASVQYFARATNHFGRSSDSSRITVRQP